MGAGVGLIVFFSAYLWAFATRGPLTAMNWFSPGFSLAAAVTSFLCVTTAGILGRRGVSVWRIASGSCLGLLVALWLLPLSDMGSHHRKEELMANPLFEMNYVWCIFAFNLLAVAVGIASAPCSLERSRTDHNREDLVQ
jgi:hypothetical protein